MSLKKEVAKNNIIFTFGNVIAAALSFVFSVVVARMLQPEQFGLFSFSLVVLGFFTAFVDMGMCSTLIKFISDFSGKGQYAKVRTLIRVFLRLKLALILCVGLFMIFFAGQISSLMFNKPNGWPFIILAAGMLIATTLFEFVNTVLVGFKNIRMLVTLRVVERVFRMAFVPFMILLGLGALGAAVGVIISFSLVTVIGFVAIKKYKQVFDKGAWGAFEKKKLLNFGSWALIGAIILNTYLIIGFLFVSILLPVENVGFYNIASSWVSLTAYIVPISCLVMYPYFSSLSRRKKSEALQSSMRYAMIPALPVSFLMSAFSGPIISFFYGDLFSQAAIILSTLSFVAVTLVLGQFLLVYLYSSGKPKLHTTIIAGMLVLAAVLDYFMISVFGVWGAAAATVIVSTVEVTLLMAAAIIKSDFRFNWMYLVKPFLASLMIYAIASLLPVGGIAYVIGYGIALLAIYTVIMLAIGGIERGDIAMALGWLRSITVKRG